MEHRRLSCKKHYNLQKHSHDIAKKIRKGSSIYLQHLQLQHLARCLSQITYLLAYQLPLFAKSQHNFVCRFCHYTLQLGDQFHQIMQGIEKLIPESRSKWKNIPDGCIKKPTQVLSQVPIIWIGKKKLLCFSATTRIHVNLKQVNKINNVSPWKSIVFPQPRNDE